MADGECANRVMQVVAIVACAPVTWYPGPGMTPFSSDRITGAHGSRQGHLYMVPCIFKKTGSMSTHVTTT